MSETGYFLVADVLGFGKIVHNLTGQELDQRITTWVSLVEVIATKYHIDKFQLISDTLFVAVESSNDRLGDLIAFSRQLLSDGIAKSFPIRGAIAHGKFNWGKLTYGQAIIAAYELEQEQNWIGITCSNNLPGVENHWGMEKLICYAPPFKRNSIILHPVISWPIPTIESLSALMTCSGLTKKGEILTWEIGQKLTNTILFSLYQKLLNSDQKAEFSKFRGLLPIHAVEAVMTTNMINTSY